MIVAGLKKCKPITLSGDGISLAISFKEIEDVLSTGILFRFNHDAQRNNIWKAKDFEAEAKKITGAKYALAVSNGSAAILAALAASGIGTGDEVICPPFTYIATVEAVLMLGALPVFAEIAQAFLPPA